MRQQTCRGRNEIQWLAAAPAARSLSKYDVLAAAVTVAADRDDDTPLQSHQSETNSVEDDASCSMVYRRSG